MSYDVDTSGMVLIRIRDLGTTILRKMWVLVQRDDPKWRVPDNDVVESI